MKNFNCIAVIAGLALTLALSSPSAMAQGGQGPGGGGYGGGAGGFGGGGGGFGGGGGGFGGGGFNITNMIQTRVDGMREPLAVTNDDDWNAISPLLLKVMLLRAQVATAGLGGMFRGGRGGGGGGGGGGGRAAGLAALFGGTSDPAAQTLDDAVNNNGSNAELKAAMTAVRESRRQKQAEMNKAQANLKEVISVRQEAYLLNGGILD